MLNQRKVECSSLKKSIVVQVAKNAKQIQEELNYVHVEVQRGENILFRGNGVFMRALKGIVKFDKINCTGMNLSYLIITSNHYLRVIHNIHGEKTSAEASQNEVTEF